MNDTPVSLLESRVDEVIADYLDAERLGIAPEPADLVAQHPDLANELRSFFSDRACFAQLAGVAVRPANGQVGGKRQDPLDPTVDFGRYVGAQFHAGGGIGDVFSATDTELHRKVALKRLKETRTDDPPSRRRFLLEAEVTARLEHPGVVPVHSLYHDQAGRPCYTMRFIEGQTLEDAIKGYHGGAPDPVAFRRLLQSFIQVCETVAYAHSRGVIHRDLKPRNVMLGKFGETMVVDWGLAKVVGRRDDKTAANPETTLRPVGDSSTDRTQMGSAVGTPAYMSPEQAAGRWDVIDAASDVYNLGAVLYAILTGQAPLDGDNWPAMQQKIQRGDFPHPRSVKPSVPRPLEAVCLRAMAMKPDDRYSSARDLAAEVERWLADEPVEAYPEPVRDRMWRWTRRHKALVGSGTVVLVIAIMSGWIISFAWSEANYQKRLAAASDSFMRARESNQDRSLRAFGNLIIRFDRLERETSACLERIAEGAGQDRPENGREFQSFRAGALREAIKFWDKAIEIDSIRDGVPGDHTHFYRCKRAICLARLGEHSQAAEEAAKLATSMSGQLSGESAYELALVHVACAMAAKDNQESAEQYMDSAMHLLQAAAEASFFKESPNAERLRTDPDLALIRSREDFAKLISQVEAKRK